MLKIKEIKKQIDVNYATFFLEHDIFNIVSSREDEKSKVLQMSDSGILIISNAGIIIEIELLFSNPKNSLSQN